LGLLFALAFAMPAAAAVNAGVIVRYKTGTTAGERLDTRQDADVTRDQSLLLPRAEVVQPQPGQSVADAVSALDDDPDVAYAEPNGVRHAFATPSDALFTDEWGLENTGQALPPLARFPGIPAVVDADIDAPAAWDISTGSRDVTIAVVDTGADFTNPDLSGEQWSNPGETGTDAQGRDKSTNGVDDDGDGFVDDAHGWDFACLSEIPVSCVNRRSNGDNSPNDLNGHGTHVAGTIGADGNDGTGVTGVNWATTILPVRVLGADGSGTDADVVNGEMYAANRGARIVNLSLGASTPLSSEFDVISSHPDTLFVVAAGNDGLNNDAAPDYPCNYDLPNILCVAATDRSDSLAQFSDFGVQSVDLAAPGVDIASTWPVGLRPARPVVAGDNRWAIESGTSMSTPLVAGVAGLVAGHHPGIGESQLRQSIVDGVDKVAGLSGKVVTGGRLNAAGALAASDRIVSPPPPPPPPPPSVVAASAATAPDRTAPTLRLDVRHRGSLRTAIRRGLRVLAHCSEGCTLSYSLLLDTSSAHRYHSRRTIATDSGALRAAATDHGVLHLRLPRKARRAHSLRLTLRVRARDAAGNRVTRTVAILLRR
jgi:subtilisin family serine protease